MQYSYSYTVNVERNPTLWIFLPSVIYEYKIPADAPSPHCPLRKIKQVAKCPIITSSLFHVLP